MGECLVSDSLVACKQVAGHERGTPLKAKGKEKSSESRVIRLSLSLTPLPFPPAGLLPNPGRRFPSRRPLIQMILYKFHRVVRTFASSCLPVPSSPHRPSRRRRSLSPHPSILGASGVVPSPTSSARYPRRQHLDMCTAGLDHALVFWPHPVPECPQPPELAELGRRPRRPAPVLCVCVCVCVGSLILDLC